MKATQAVSTRSFKTNRHRILAAITVTLVAALGTVIGASPAYANSGSGYIYRAPTTSYGYYEYNNNGTDGTGTTVTRLLSNPATMTSGYCYDIWLDHHKVTSGHYDPRAARSCKSLYQRDSGYNDEAGALNGLNRLGVCYGPNNATTTTANCTMVTGSITGINSNLPNNCARAWVMTSGGSAVYYSGGDSFSCTS